MHVQCIIYMISVHVMAWAKIYTDLACTLMYVFIINCIRCKLMSLDKVFSGGCVHVCIIATGKYEKCCWTIQTEACI